VRALIVQSEYYVYRYEPDLGYLPAPTPAAKIRPNKAGAQSLRLRAELARPTPAGRHLCCAKIDLCTRNPTSACSSSAWAQWAIFFTRCLR